MPLLVYCYPAPSTIPISSSLNPYRLYTSRSANGSSLGVNLPLEHGLHLWVGRTGVRSGRVALVEGQHLRDEGHQVIRLGSKRQWKAIRLV